MSEQPQVQVRQVTLGDPPPIDAVKGTGVWVVVPMHDEGAVISEVIHELLEAFDGVVAVDDGSRDSCGAVARGAGAQVIRHSVNLGQGAALQTGISYALELGAGYIVTFDADGQHRIEDAVGMVMLAQRDDLAIVFGSRFLDDRTKPGWFRSTLLRTAVWVTNQSTGMSLTDAHNGLRVIRADAARAINIHHDRMSHASEIVMQLYGTQLPYAEYPVEILYTDYSRGKGQSLWNSVNILVDLLTN